MVPLRSSSCRSPDLVVAKPFPSAFTTIAFGYSRRRWFETCSCKPVPRGLPSSVKQLRTTQHFSFRARGTHKSRYRSATWKAAENDCLERRNLIRPRVPSHVAYKAERGGNEPFWSPWTMYPRSQERRRNREATVYLPALGGDGPRLDRTVRIYKCSQASSAEESLKCCAALLAVSTEA